MRLLAGCLLVASFSPALFAAEAPESARSFLGEWCSRCHSGPKGLGGFSVDKLTAQSVSRATLRVRNMEMPPRSSPSPTLNAREAFVKTADEYVRAEACSAPPPAAMAHRIRRLNRDEFAATVRDLLNVNIDVGGKLPVEGAGGEGFDNAAETLIISPIHAEKYLDAARSALEFAATDARAKAAIFFEKPGNGVSEEAAARRIFDAFLPRAFRQPVEASASDRYVELFRTARGNGDSFEEAVLYSLRAVLLSPRFLFRLEESEGGDYAMASRLSYFLWGSMPDELLWDIAALGRLREPEILRGQIRRLLRHPKSTEFQRRFIEQWLRTRDLGRDKSPDPELFPVWASSEEVRSDIRYQPVLFLRELMTKDLSLLNLIDSKFSILNRTLARLYKVDVQWRRDAAQALYPVQLPEGSDRGGLLGMPGILALTSYPNRTSPVLRGAWVLETLLGTPPPPAPPGVPPLENTVTGRPASVRERLTMHRANPACASCHERMDPIGFALENYDAMGFWRTEDSGRPVDVSGELPDGTKFQGPRELKAALLAKKDLFIRTLTSKMLGYALGRGLTLQDSCTVDAIAARVRERDYSAVALIEEIVFSAPFQGGESRKQR